MYIFIHPLKQVTLTLCPVPRQLRDNDLTLLKSIILNQSSNLLIISNPQSPTILFIEIFLFIIDYV